jgi:hypothetical protein
MGYECFLDECVDGCFCVKGMTNDCSCVSSLRFCLVLQDSMALSLRAFRRAGDGGGGWRGVLARDRILSSFWVVRLQFFSFFVMLLWASVNSKSLGA